MVKDYGNDTKKLYELINNITGSITQNPMPPGKSDSDLAEHFSRYFISKIDKIRDLFTDVPSYNPDVNESIPQFANFEVLTEPQIEKLVASLKTKSCELNPIPTKLLKMMLPLCLPLLTKIINFSLTRVNFANNGRLP